MDMRAVQARLITLGYDLGPYGVDGMAGTMTRKAIAAFQHDRGIPVINPGTIAEDGATMTALFGPGATASIEVVAPWYGEARRCLGIREIAGSKTNPIIAGWLDELGAGWNDDEAAWCGTFVGHCIASTLPDEPLPANPFGARQWEKFGVPLKTPALGAILTFWRTSPASWQGHVGLYGGEDATNYHVVGGNQSNMVSIAKVAKSRLTAMRWPATVALPTAGRVVGDLAGGVSTNEA